jgi:PAP2 superfamily
MLTNQWSSFGRTWVVAVGITLLAACGGGGSSSSSSNNDSNRMTALGASFGGNGNDNDDTDRETAPGRRVSVVDQGENVVWRWGQVAAATITSAAPAPRVTPQEQRPQWAIDLATVHAAIYDAVIAIAGTHKPYAIIPQTSAAGASMDAAATAAAYGVLQGLFPNRSAVYQPTYDALLAAMPDGAPKTQGLALGAEVAAGMLALRANDGRSTVLPPFVPGTEPGQFRGVNPAVPFYPYIKPFTLTSAAQFRTDGPPALGSGTYADDLNEVKAWGSATSTLRSAEQTENARFHTELPNFHFPRNLAQFARSQPSLAENARLAALIWVTMADTTLGCFESKYHFLFWRPASAVRLADTDGNDETVADPAWTPLEPAPNHPAYPAAHSCVSSAIAEVLSSYYGTRKLSFSFDSTVTATTHAYASVKEMVRESRFARIWGGIDFRTALEDGAVLGAKTARWVEKHHFTPLKCRDSNRSEAHGPSSPEPYPSSRMRCSSDR